MKDTSAASTTAPVSAANDEAIAELDDLLQKEDQTQPKSALSKVQKKKRIDDVIICHRSMFFTPGREERQTDQRETERGTERDRDVLMTMTSS